MTKKLAKFALFGLLIGYLLAVLLGRWTWLEMRVNTSLILPVVLIVGLLIGIFCKKSFSKIYFFLFEAIFFVTVFVIYRDLGAFEVIPGVRLREGFFLSFLSLTQANIILILLLVIGNILWLLREKSCYDCCKINRWRM